MQKILKILNEGGAGGPLNLSADVSLRLFLFCRRPMFVLLSHLAIRNQTTSESSFSKTAQSASSSTKKGLLGRKSPVGADTGGQKSAAGSLEGSKTLQAKSSLGDSATNSAGDHT